MTTPAATDIQTKVRAALDDVNSYYAALQADTDKSAEDRLPLVVQLSNLMTSLTSAHTAADRLVVEEGGSS